MHRRLVSYGLVVLVTLVLSETFHPLAAIQTLAQGGCQTFPETGKTVCAPFLTYWQQHGGLAQQGYPISSQFTEISELDGKTYSVQYFERAEFEYHPEFAGTPNEVLLSQLGTFQFERKYPNGETAPVATPTSAPAAKIYDFGEDITLAPGITLQAYSFKLERTTPSSDPHMFWDLMISNKTGADFPLQLAKSDISVRDDLGNNFPIDDTSISLSPVAKPDHPFPTELMIFTRDQQVIDTVKYFDLTLAQLSGIKGPWTFRRYIQQ